MTVGDASDAEATHVASVSGCSDRTYGWASVLLFLLVAFWGLYSLPDYGMSWDEFFRWKGGQEKLLYYKVLLSGGDAQAVLPSKDLYPGLFDLTLAAANEVLPFGLLALGHGLSLALGVGAVAGAWAIGRLLGGARLAFWCAFFLLMIPRFYGHMFFNPKDIPFAAGMVWSLYFLLRWGRWLPTPRLGASLALGVAIGLTLALRIGGLVFFGYVAGYAGFVLLRELLVGRVGWRAWIRSVLRVAVHGLLVAVVAFIVLVPWWPAIHSNPLVKPFQSLGAVSQYPWSGLVLFRGEFIPAPDLPWYYPLTWLAITLPDFLIAVLAAGLVLAAVKFRQLAGALFTGRGFPWVVVATTVVFPLLFVIVRDSVLYDGMRHLLFILPPLACLGAFAWTRLVDVLRCGWRIVAGVVLAVLMLMQLPVVYRLHPYEYVFFNQVSGGVQSKAGRYEGEYWGTSLREASQWLIQHVPAGNCRVATSAPPLMAILYLPERFQLVSPRDNPDFFISLTRLNYDQRMPGETVQVIGRLGIPMAVIKDLRGFSPTAPAQGEMPSGSELPLELERPPVEE
ncbi:hypothetical protein H5P28_12715 [Ruficoccus amylovorans]|uniref:Glycosyltransferase RgtA/B/C/D-like domain-containing protein n=1 Tax=Ruficoccus amylovorans TaxID=1804625 RepID=A0A842HFC4_9BACT|nr:hypothetical protein [Ruficoccus amylovorans]MBC2595122.1 hypothetical protein [Ruficoccus amylovorans]